jgi:acetoacetyl-CoA synthetase
MLTVRKAYAEDFEKIYPLLLEINNKRITKAGWQRIFRNHWNAEEDYFGYVLVDQQEILGFMSTIFSKRVIDGQLHNFCNLSTWIVKEEARNKSLLLVSPILQLTNYTFTMFTLAGKLEVIWEKFGFKRLNSSYKLLLPLPSITGSFLAKKGLITFDHRVIERHLTATELAIFHDHARYNCAFSFIRSDNGNCLIILRRIIRKGLPFVYIHYLSNKEVFSRYINVLRLTIMRQLKVLGIAVQERHLANNINIPHTISLSSDQCYNEYYKSDRLAPHQIDDLYSELFLLDV